MRGLVNERVDGSPEFWDRHQLFRRGLVGKSMGVPHSRDAAFEEAGLDNDAAMHATGRRYRDTILAQGGSREPMANCRDFRGREPTTDALLRHSGLVAA